MVSKSSKYFFIQLGTRYHNICNAYQILGHVSLDQRNYVIISIVNGVTNLATQLYLISAVPRHFQKLYSLR